MNKEGKDWDQLIPYLLFAYREVPQSSSGFSPFELLYGRTVKGPLDVIHGAWSTTEQADEYNFTCIDYLGETGEDEGYSESES